MNIFQKLKHSFIIFIALIVFIAIIPVNKIQSQSSNQIVTLINGQYKNKFSDTRSYGTNFLIEDNQLRIDGNPWSAFKIIKLQDGWKHINVQEVVKIEFDITGINDGIGKTIQPRLYTNNEEKQYPEITLTKTKQNIILTTDTPESLNTILFWNNHSANTSYLIDNVTITQSSTLQSSSTPTSTPTTSPTSSPTNTPAPTQIPTPNLGDIQTLTALQNGQIINNFSDTWMYNTTTTVQNNMLRVDFNPYATFKLVQLDEWRLQTVPGVNTVEFDIINNSGKNVTILPRLTGSNVDFPNIEIQGNDLQHLTLTTNGSEFITEFVIFNPNDVEVSLFINNVVYHYDPNSPTPTPTPIPTPMPMPTNGPPQNLNLSINASNTIHPFREEMLGMALVDWAHAWNKPLPGDVPGLSQAFKAAGIKLIRYAGGLHANDVGWEEVEKRTPHTTRNPAIWEMRGNSYKFHYGNNEIDSLAKLAQEADAYVMMQINIDEFDPIMWADLVRYTNTAIDGGKDFRLSNGQHVFKYWEYGNELNLTEWTGDTQGMTPAEYAKRAPAYISAMKAIDPSIKIIAGATAGAHGAPFLHNWNNNWNQGTNFSTNLSEYLSLSSSIQGVDSLSYHWYQGHNTQNDPYNERVPNMFTFIHPDTRISSNLTHWNNSQSRQWTKITPNRIDNEIIGSKNQTQGVTELNYDAGDFGIAPENANHANAVWAADVLGRLAYNGTDYVTWYTGYGGGNQGYPAVIPIPNDTSPTSIKLRPSYYTFFMYANFFGDQMVESNSSNESQLSIWASTDSHEPDALKLMVVNTSESNITAPINIDGFNANSANVYEMVSENPTSMENDSHDNHTTTINGITLNDMNVSQSTAEILKNPITIQVSNNSISHVFKPYSVTAIILTPTIRIPLTRIGEIKGVQNPSNQLQKINTMNEIENILKNNPKTQDAVLNIIKYLLNNLNIIDMLITK